MVTPTDKQAEVILAGCGAPKRGMGWYHAVQLLKNKCPSAVLSYVVEPWFLGGGAFFPMIWDPRPACPVGSDAVLSRRSRPCRLLHALVIWSANRHAPLPICGLCVIENMQDSHLLYGTPILPIPCSQHSLCQAPRDQEGLSLESGRRRLRPSTEPSS